MKVRILVVVGWLISLTCACFAQDVIVTKDARKINAKVTEVNVNDIKYKNFDNLDGPTYTLLKSDVASILYQNGQVDTFGAENPERKTADISDFLDSLRQNEAENQATTSIPVQSQSQVTTQLNQANNINTKPFSIVPEKMKPPKSNSQRTYYNYLLNFERNLKLHGYTKQITLWDFLPPKGRTGSQAAYIGDRDYAKLATCFIGIWVNFKDELVMFRTDGDIMAEGQVVPFDQIAEVRIKIDAYEETKTRGGGTSVLSGAVGIGSANTRTVSQEKVKGAEVTVVTKSANGVKNYRINVSGRHSVQAIRLVEDIADEIGFILNGENRKE